MRRIFKLSALCLAVGALSACNPEQTIETAIAPTAGVRFINAVPDTGAFDFRFVDLVENSAHWGQAFRNNPSIASNVTTSQGVQFKPARAGERHFRIFMNSTNQAVAQTVVKDTVVSLQPDHNYTIILWGRARTGATPALKLSVIDETVPDPGNQVALRVINATESAIDVRYYSSTGTPPAAATWAAVQPLSVSAYVTTAPGQFRFNVQPAGGGTALVADGLALVGAAAVTTAPGPTDALPGTTVAGSAVTAIVFPRSIAGTQAPQTTGSATVPSYAAPALTFVWDRRPPRPPGI
jgi:Domain of unknown function (DUF4397)